MPQQETSRVKYDWEAIAAAVNAELGKTEGGTVSVSMVVNVAKGWTRSARVLAVLCRVCPECLSRSVKPKSARPVPGLESVD